MVLTWNINEMFLNRCSSIHNNPFSSGKVFFSESGEKYAQIERSLQAKTVQKV